MSPEGLSTPHLGRMHDVIAGHVESGEVSGIVTLVSRHGEAHVDAIGMKAVGGGDPMRRDTIFRIASMTKPVVAGRRDAPLRARRRRQRMARRAAHGPPRRGVNMMCSMAAGSSKPLTESSGNHALGAK